MTIQPSPLLCGGGEYDGEQVLMICYDADWRFELAYILGAYGIVKAHKVQYNNTAVVYSMFMIT